MSKMDMKSPPPAPAPAPKQDAPPMDKMAKGEMKGMDMPGMKMDAKAGPHQASGTVKSLDATAQVVTLDHAPVASMNWPAMTMSFKVKDKAMLDKLAAGKKVEVEFVQQGGDYVITDVK
jgi:Cu/Ag efflux protein CusF